MRKYYIVIVCTITALTCYVHKKTDSALIQENVEALSDSPENGIKKVSDIAEYLVENIEEKPDSFDTNGKILTWKDEIVSVTHIIKCSETEGLLTCKSRKDIHSKDYPEECPYAHLY